MMNVEGRTEPVILQPKRPAGKLELSTLSSADLLGEVKRRWRQGEFRLDLARVPDQDLWREVGRRRQARRKVHRGGPGRPPKPRCRCGRFTQDAAERKGHFCGAGSDPGS
jgi:hypothetical protein